MKNQSFPQDAIHKFTMYSIRATHITHELLRGSDIEILAINVGNSPPVIRSNYRRPMQRLSAKYLANASVALQEFDEGNVLESINNLEEIVGEATAKLLADSHPDDIRDVLPEILKERADNS